MCVYQEKSGVLRESLPYIRYILHLPQILDMNRKVVRIVKSNILNESFLAYFQKFENAHFPLSNWNNACPRNNFNQTDLNTFQFNALMPSCTISFIETVEQRLVVH